MKFSSSWEAIQKHDASLRWAVRLWNSTETCEKCPCGCAVFSGAPVVHVQGSMELNAEILLEQGRLVVTGRALSGSSPPSDRPPGVEDRPSRYSRCLRGSSSYMSWRGCKHQVPPGRIMDFTLLPSLQLLLAVDSKKADPDHTKSSLGRFRQPSWEISAVTSDGPYDLASCKHWLVKKRLGPISSLGLAQQFQWQAPYTSALRGRHTTYRLALTTLTCLERIVPDWIRGDGRLLQVSLIPFLLGGKPD